MTKVCADFSDKEYEIFTSLKTIEGTGGEKLRNLFRYYLSTIPELKSSDYALKRFENKEFIEGILKDVQEDYKNTEYPKENWKDDKINKLANELIEINVISKVGEKRFVPTSKFRDLFKILLHDIATESKDMDEYVAAVIAVVQLLMEFGVGTLSKETIKDATIFLIEGWLFAYPKVMKEAREFQKTKKLTKKLILLESDESLKAYIEKGE